jgi:hypothetical protein
MATQGTTGKPVKSGALASVGRVIAAAAPALVTAGGIMLSSAHKQAPPPPAPPAMVQSASAAAIKSGSSAFVPVVGAPTLTGVHCGTTKACPAPYPMLAKGHPVDWFFVFKLNAKSFPGCAGGSPTCPFGGGTPGTYKQVGQQYAVASSEAPQLVDGVKDCLGMTTQDPVGATFDEIYNGGFHYVVWNDQFLGHPKLPCGEKCGPPWAHSKGILAWNDAGEGMVMQVSTPSWPGSGSAKNPRVGDDNTLGCMTDNDVEVSQHFFALKLSHADLVQVMTGMGLAAVATDVTLPSLANPTKDDAAGSDLPDDVKAAFGKLGLSNKSMTVQTGLLSSGIRLIVKPSSLHVPPWQMVSAELGGVSLRVANWYVNQDPIPSTTGSTAMGCWDTTQLGKPGAVEIAISGMWDKTPIGLTGGDKPDGNHAKVGVTTSGGLHYAIFGDENQEGDITGSNCDASQNGRGGMFFVMNNPAMAGSLAAMIKGESAPLAGPGFVFPTSGK